MRFRFLGLQNDSEHLEKFDANFTFNPLPEIFGVRIAGRSLTDSTPANFCRTELRQAITH